MPNDILGGLGGLMKGLTGFMPQDDPDVRLMNAQTEINDFKQQENDIFAEIGRQAYAANPSAFPYEEKLRLIQMNIAEAERKLAEAKVEKEQSEADTARNTCSECGHINPDGTKFCQECGNKLGISEAICTNCGLQNPPGTRFCGDCGIKLG